jgi:hypothetical protein
MDLKAEEPGKPPRPFYHQLQALDTTLILHEYQRCGDYFSIATGYEGILQNADVRRKRRSRNFGVRQLTD